MVNIPVILVVLLLLAWSHVGTCLVCYLCAALHTTNCKHPFNPEGIRRVPCDPLNACIKFGEGDRLGRSCGDHDGCQSREGCYSCQKDLCNSSSSIMPSIIMTSAVSVIVATINYLFPSR